MRIILSTFLVAVSVLGSSCSLAQQTNAPRDTKTAEEPRNEVSANETESDTTTKKECAPKFSGDVKVLKSQTFAIDFEPYKGSCFVTTHTSERPERPIGSVIAIYKDGEKTTGFDTRYQKDAATCRVEAVAFEDVDKDGNKDVIVVGKCGAKAGDIQGNEIHFNTGKGFRTSIKGNDGLENVSTIKDVIAFARKNADLFR